MSTAIPEFKARQGASSTPRKFLSPGMYVARCYQLVELGTHEEEYLGVKKTPFKVWIAFEFPTKLDVFKEGGQPEPYSMGKEYSFYMNDKANLRKDIESWMGMKMTDQQADDFNLGRLLGQPCLINVQGFTIKNGPNAGNESVKIGTISPLMEGQVCPPAVNPVQAFSLDPSGFDQAVFEKLPGFLSKKITAAPEYGQAIAVRKPSAGQYATPAGPPVIKDAVPTNMQDDFGDSTPDEPLPF